MTFTAEPTILVTGATGNVGHTIVSQFANLAIPIRALSRNPNVAGNASTVEMVRGDLSVPSSIEPALAGIESVFLICRGYPPAAISPLVTVLAKHVRRIVFLSSSAIQDELPMQTNPIGKIHLDVEQAIRNSGAEWTFLRPGAFAANAVTWWAPQLRSGDVLRWPYADAAWAPIHERDIGSVAVRALTESRHMGKTYFLTGGEALTQAEQLRIIGDAAKRSFRYAEISPDEAKKQMSSSMPSFVADGLLSIWAGMIDHPGPVSRAFEEVTGQLPSTFHQWADDHASDFRSSSAGD